MNGARRHGGRLLSKAATRDVTQQRKQRDDLERANQALETFAYSVAHDLRTPLRALAGYSAALLEDFGDTLGEVGRSYAERIEIASEHMSTLIDNLLHLSRVSRVKINLQPVDLAAHLSRMAAELQRSDPDRHVRFIIEQPVRVMADDTLMRSLLQSLLSNAWKFTSGQQDALIEFGTMKSADDAYVCCYVRDNGAGFDSSYVHKLFIPFQRLHTPSEFQGTGVGLASVRQIVERHGGTVRAEGKIGNGATFYFSLPAVRSPARPCCAQQPAPQSGKER
ncbi:MAG TPA: ATP-binding protein [Streptosporangiaceae bacterium]|nr:ATP-binding protein [Streptosporangiaceae bacterium]